MFHESLPIIEEQAGEYAELQRDDILLAIETAKAEGFHSTSRALFELLDVLDEVLGVGGSIEFRVPKHKASYLPG